MISHVFVGVNDFAPALRLYGAVLAELGLVVKFSDPAKPWAAWMKPGQARPLFVIGAPFDGQAASAGNGQMTALLAPSRMSVDNAYRAALDAGAMCDGAPGLRPHYHPDYYGAYFRDMDGNKIGLCCHDAP